MAKKFRSISEISIYTYDDEISLKSVFQRIFDATEGQKSIDHKSSKADLENYFREVLPEYDEDRVYQSHIKKVIQWYNILIDNDFTDFSEDSKTDEEE